MSVLVWDSTSQAFKEAPTPMKFDATNGAWKETTGLAWDAQNQAWVEKWSPVEYIIKNGSMDNITVYKTGNSNSSLSQKSDDGGNYLYWVVSNLLCWSEMVFLRTIKKYDVSKYSKLCIKWKTITQTKDWGMNIQLQKEQINDSYGNDNLGCVYTYSEGDSEFLELDISNITDSCYIYIRCAFRYSATLEQKIYDLWLE